MVSVLTPILLLLSYQLPIPPLTLLLSPGALVLGRHVHDAVGVDVEGDLDLWDATRGRRDPHQGELTQHLVVQRHLSLALAHLDLHLSLSVCCRGKHLVGRSVTMTDTLNMV